MPDPPLNRRTLPTSLHRCCPIKLRWAAAVQGCRTTPHYYLHCFALPCPKRPYPALTDTTLHCANSYPVPACTTLHCAQLLYTAPLHYSALPCTSTLHFPALPCITLHYPTPCITLYNYIPASLIILHPCIAAARLNYPRREPNSSRPPSP